MFVKVLFVRFSIIALLFAEALVNGKPKSYGA